MTEEEWEEAQEERWYCERRRIQQQAEEQQEQDYWEFYWSPEGWIDRFTKRSAKDTVEINECDCKSDASIGRLMPRDWSCKEGGTYYCPGCDKIMCGTCVAASQEAFFAD